MKDKIAENSFGPVMMRTIQLAVFSCVPVTHEVSNGSGLLGLAIVEFKAMRVPEKDGRLAALIKIGRMSDA